MSEYDKLRELERLTGYQFSSKEWLCRAMRHSSYTNEHRMDRGLCNERLEFLGDAVLELVSSEYLYAYYPDVTEGSLTKMRASLVCEPTLAFDAKALNLGSFLLLGKGEERTGGRDRDSVVSDAMEALIGGIYKDGGLEPAKEFILRFILDDVENKQLFYDSKTVLQELVHKDSAEAIEYVLLGTEGPEHDKIFHSEVRIEGVPMGEGKGRTKKSAEQKAAYAAISKLKDEAGDKCI